MVCSEEAFEYPNDLEMLKDKEVKLSAYIPKYSKIKYIYDFGDDWQHYIEVEKMIEDYPQNYPVCLDWEGNAPPEDVGGDSGYEEFLEAFHDPDHEEHENRGIFSLVNYSFYRCISFNLWHNMGISVPGD
ncbi:MAG: plasmid pRiA4b ORF-3 family protein [Desulfitobacteriaceae bacterium]